MARVWHAQPTRRPACKPLADQASAKPTSVHVVVLAAYRVRRRVFGERSDVQDNACLTVYERNQRRLWSSPPVHLW